LSGLLTVAVGGAQAALLNPALSLFKINIEPSYRTVRFGYCGGPSPAVSEWPLLEVNQPFIENQ